MKRKASGQLGDNERAGLVSCPICSRQVPMAIINVHLDTSCQASVSASPPLPRRQIGDPKSQPIASKSAVRNGTQKPKEELFTDCQASETPAHSKSPPACLPSAETSHLPEGGVPETESQQPQPLNGAGPEADLHQSIEVEGKKRIGPQASLLLQRMAAAANNKLPGQHLFPDFISAEEEADLIYYIEHCQPPWHLSTFNGAHRGKAWGVRMDLQKRLVSPPKHEMPDILMKLAQRMRGLKPLKDFHPTEANANEYTPSQGQFLGPHVDDRQLSTGAIVTLSLVDAATMTFQRDRQKDAPKVRVLLPARSLQALTGESRYSFTHAIALEDFKGSKRLSVTFRQSPLKLR